MRIVALGASAGGLASLGHVLESLPASFPAPILVALHLDPNHRSHAVALLQHRTKLKVRVARGGAVANAGTVYLAPPDRHLRIQGGILHLTHAARVNFSRPSVDVLFLSAAADYGSGATVAVLSGNGSDGAAGVVAVKAQGGLAVAEGPDSAAFRGMPDAAKRTGLLDAVLPADQIGAFLSRATEVQVSVTQRQWLRMLALLRTLSGAEFSKYRTTTLQRRLQQRIAARGCRTMDQYLRILARDAREATRLQASFLIKVSAFMRDPTSWVELERQVVELARKGGPLRAWSAGCATGEEPYSLALTFARVLGTGPEADWKVFATDLDEEALAFARVGRYTDGVARGVAPADLAAFFVREGGAWRVGKALRARLVFGRHDLLSDPPLASIDVLTCRNVLIYFTPKEKELALARLALAVRPGGLLFLGRSEALGRLDAYARIGNSTLFRRTGLSLPMSSPTASKNPKAPRGARRPTPRPTRPSAPPEGSEETRFLAQQNLNDELQSRNEELETVNEELQSLNDELSMLEEQMRGLDEQSRTSNEFLQRLLNTSTDAIVACDQDNRITFWSRSAIKRFRLSPAQAVGGNLFELVPSLDQPSLRAAIRKVRQAARPSRETFRMVDAEVSVDPLPAAAGERGGFALRVRSVR